MRLYVRSFTTEVGTLKSPEVGLQLLIPVKPNELKKLEAALKEFTELALSGQVEIMPVKDLAKADEG